MNNYNTIESIVAQIELCKFIDEQGHSIKSNAAFIALKEMCGKTLMPTYKPGDIVWFMKDNKPTRIKISASEIFNVDSNQARISYSAEDCENPKTWIDHQYLQEPELFLSKEALLKSL